MLFRKRKKLKLVLKMVKEMATAMEMIMVTATEMAMEMGRLQLQTLLPNRALHLLFGMVALVGELERLVKSA
jgi:hypothetical protein